MKSRILHCRFCANPHCSSGVAHSWGSKILVVNVRKYGETCTSGTTCLLLTLLLGVLPPSTFFKIGIGRYIAKKLHFFLLKLSLLKKNLVTSFRIACPASFTVTSSWPAFVTSWFWVRIVKKKLTNKLHLLVDFNKIIMSTCPWRFYIKCIQSRPQNWTISGCSE